MQLTCEEISGSACDYTAVGKTATEVEGKLLHHGIQEHPDLMEEMSEEEMIAMMGSMHKKLAEQM